MRRCRWGGRYAGAVWLCVRACARSCAACACVCCGRGDHSVAVTLINKVYYFLLIIKRLRRADGMHRPSRTSASLSAPHIRKCICTSCFTRTRTYFLHMMKAVHAQLCPATPASIALAASHLPHSPSRYSRSEGRDLYNARARVPFHPLFVSACNSAQICATRLRHPACAH